MGMMKARRYGLAFTMIALRLAFFRIKLYADMALIMIRVLRAGQFY